MRQNKSDFNNSQQNRLNNSRFFPYFLCHFQMKPTKVYLEINFQIKKDEIKSLKTSVQGKREAKEEHFIWVKQQNVRTSRENCDWHKSWLNVNVNTNAGNISIVILWTSINNSVIGNVHNSYEYIYSCYRWSLSNSCCFTNSWHTQSQSTVFVLLDNIRFINYANFYLFLCTLYNWTLNKILTNIQSQEILSSNLTGREMNSNCSYEWKFSTMRNSWMLQCFNRMFNNVFQCFHTTRNVILKFLSISEHRKIRLVITNI